MRRLAFVLASALLAGGLTAPAYAVSSPAPAPLPLTGPIFVNYGPHAADRVIPATTTQQRTLARTTTLGRSSTNPAYSGGISPFSANTAQVCALRPATLPTGLTWTNVCVHYQSGTPSALTPNATTPAFAKSVASAFKSAENRYVTSGYKAPQADPATPSTMHVYLENMSSFQGGQFAGAYGFTTNASDEGIHGGGDRAAYMVLDNDFSCQDFGDACNNPFTPTDVMSVTVAHEFFHATQFAYDTFEDTWFMESTATWAETQVFPNLPDNIYYLYAPGAGVITGPNQPIDDNSGGAASPNPADPSHPYPGGLAVYQDWLFWQYLGEHVPGAVGKMPSLVLNSWRYADATWTKGFFSITAVKHAVERAGKAFRPIWRDFSYANVAPVYSYANGSHYPAATVAWARTISPSALGPIATTRYVPHLASQTMRLTSSNLPSNQGVHLAFRVANRTVSSVTVVVYLRNGDRRIYQLDVSKGAASLNLGIGSGAVSSVAITFSNAGIGYTGCDTKDPGFSCHGTSTVGKVGFSWSASFYRG